MLAQAGNTQEIMISKTLSSLVLQPCVPVAQWFKALLSKAGGCGFEPHSRHPEVGNFG